MQRHLATCGTCSAEAERIRATVDWHRRALPCLVSAAEVNPDPLRIKLLSALAAEPERTSSAWTSVFRPLALAGAAVVAGAILLVLSEMGGPRAVLIPLGVQSPPVAVTREPDLFENYQLIQELDVLENFDTVESEPLDDDQTLQQG